MRSARKYLRARFGIDKTKDSPTLAGSKMIYEYRDKRYEVVFGSDVEANGVYLEARDVANPIKVVLLAFWSDDDGSFTFSAHQQDLPFDFVETFIRVARERCPSRTPGPE